MVNGLFMIIGLGLFAFYSLGLWNLAQSRQKRRNSFYLLFFTPYLILLIPMLIALFKGNVFISIFTNNPLITLLIVAIILAYLYLWARSVYNSAGEKEFWWFFFLLLISPLWIVYVATKKQRRRLF